VGIDRRKFIKVAGLTALGLAGGTAPKILSQEAPEVDSSGAEGPVSEPSKPLVASRWAMVIDIRKCLEYPDCNDCSRVCHYIHNVPEFENPKDEIKWIWKESFSHAFHEQSHEYLPAELKHAPVMVLCNHCDNPACTKVCPTRATWKRDKDGIVMMDWHRCCGCRYCMAACPYGSRSFNWRDPRPFIEDTQPDYPTRTRGVVEKCTFCEERLARGSLPACVEECKHGALTFGDLEDPESEVRKLLLKNHAIRRKPGLGTQPEIYYLV
jgi:molybdopterin-containing oxidoreductase family iron-sulfur binding subunit